MRIFVVSLILLHFSIINGFSQESKIDSLKNLISIQENDTIKVSLLFLLSGEYRRVNSPEEFQILVSALNISKNAQYGDGLARANRNLTLYYFRQNQFDSALYRAQAALKVYSSSKNQKQVAHIYSMIATIKQSNNDFDSAFIYYDLAHSIRDSIDDEYGIAQSLLDKAGAYNTIGNNKLALKYALEALEYFKKNDKQLDASYAMNVIGIIYDAMGIYDEALTYYFQSLEIANDTKDQSAAVTLYNNIALIYDYMANQEKAQEYFQKASEILEQINDKSGQALIYNNMAEVEAQLGDTLGAINHLQLAVVVNKGLNDICDLSYNYEGLGNLYVGQNRLDSAYFFLTEAIAFGEICRDKALLSSAHKNLGLLHMKRKNNKEAAHNLHKSLILAESAGFRQDIKASSEELSKFYESTGDLKKSLFYHKLFQKTKDSIFNAETSDHITRMTVEYDFKKEKRLLELENEKNSLKLSAELEREALNRNTILIVLLLSIILIGTLLRAYFIISNRNKKLTTLNEEKNTLIGVVAHDLRSPLNNMKSLVPIIRNSSTEITEEQDHYLDLFDQSTARMSDMINRVLDINAIEAQKVMLRVEDCDIAEVLEGTIQSFDVSLKKKNIALFKNFEKEKAHIAKIDRNYLFQVFENIISNAIKFSKEGTKLFLTVKSDNGYIVVSIRDQGPGIRQEELALLFQRYQKLTAIPTANESSTGLGLSHAKKYVEAMKGRIWCESTLGKGSTFYVSFKESSDNPASVAAFF